MSGSDPDRYVFPGDAVHLHQALADEEADPATAVKDIREFRAFSRLTSLVSQACHGDRAHATGVLAAAAVQFRTIAAAAEAAYAILQEAAGGLGLNLTHGPGPVEVRESESEHEGGAS